MFDVHLFRRRGVEYSLVLVDFVLVRHYREM